MENEGNWFWAALFWSFDSKYTDLDYLSTVRKETESARAGHDKKSTGIRHDIRNTQGMQILS